LGYGSWSFGEQDSQEYSWQFAFCPNIQIFLTDSNASVTQLTQQSSFDGLAIAPIKPSCPRKALHKHRLLSLNFPKVAIACRP
jgi:hypothetical protein